MELFAEVCRRRSLKGNGSETYVSEIMILEGEGEVCTDGQPQRSAGYQENR